MKEELEEKGIVKTSVQEAQQKMQRRATVDAMEEKIAARPDAPPAPAAE